MDTPEASPTAERLQEELQQRSPDRGSLDTTALGCMAAVHSFGLLCKDPGTCLDMPADSLAGLQGQRAARELPCGVGMFLPSSVPELLVLCRFRLLLRPARCSARHLWPGEDTHSMTGAADCGSYASKPPSSTWHRGLTALVQMWQVEMLVSLFGATIKTLLKVLYVALANLPATGRTATLTLRHSQYCDSTKKSASA